MFGASAGASAWVTPSGFTSIITGGDATVSVGAFYKIATGSESGTIAMTCTGAFITAGQIARYSTSALTSPTEGAATNSGSSASAAPSSVTTAGADRLVICLIATDSSSTTTAAISGATGGTWTESAAEQTGISLTNDYQHSAIAVAGTLSGGTAALSGSAAWRSITFALKPFVQTAGGGISRPFMPHIIR